MPPGKKDATPDQRVQTAIVALQKLSTKRDRENLARFGINARKAFGVSMANIQTVAKRLGRDHQLAAALWDAGWYEARMLTAFVDDPSLVTAAQMDRWCRDFDNWGICDTLCFFLFDRTPHAWTKVAQWSKKRDEFVKRAAFALIAGLALHDKQAGDEPFVNALARGASGQRRPQLRQEGRELGAPRGRAPQPVAECCRDRNGATTVGVGGPCRALDRQERGQGVDEPDGATKSLLHT